MDIEVENDLQKIKKLIYLALAYEELKQGKSISTYTEQLTNQTLSKLDKFKAKYNLKPDVLLATLEDMKSKGEVDDIAIEVDLLISQLKSLLKKGKTDEQKTT